MGALVRAGLPRGIAPLSGDPVELEDTFDDASLEMNAGGDKFRVGSVAGKSGVLADPQTPAVHASMHQLGGAGQISVAGLSGVLADAQRSNVLAFSGGDKTLGAVTSGQALVVSGTTIVSQAIPVTKVVQVVRTESATPASSTAIIPVDNTIPQSTEGTAYPDLDTTITPSAASSTLLVEVFVPMVSASTILNIIGAIFRDSGVDAISLGINSVEATNRVRQLRAEARVVAGSTAPTTFKLRFGTVAAGTVYMLQTGVLPAYFGGVLKASLTVTEIAA